ncbi:hypothetical protein [Noviherbaspirillum malthae]|uniref:hypothetical protein n=1 Tax=Noviherbaspirillum malthae TaxID=1260987 RepID=UPI00188F2BE6|nr:hypothetical protein [Noviherbaspirillum malthae]
MARNVRLSTGFVHKNVAFLRRAQKDVAQIMLLGQTVFYTGATPHNCGAGKETSMEHLIHQESKAGRRTALFNLRRVQTAACVGMTLGAGIIVLMLKAI